MDINQIPSVNSAKETKGWIELLNVPILFMIRSIKATSYYTKVSILLGFSTVMV